MRIYLFEGRHGFRPQDVFKFISVAPIIKDLFLGAKLLQKSEMRKDIVIELSYKGFG